MADFKCPEMANDGRRLLSGARYVAVGGVGREEDEEVVVGRKRSVWTAGYRLVVGCALGLTIGSLLISTVCLWRQGKLEAENSALKGNVESLENRILAVEERLLQSETAVAFGQRSESSLSAINQQQQQQQQQQPSSSHHRIVDHGRFRRSIGEQHRDRRRKSTRAAHYQLDGGDGTTTAEFKWRVWNGQDTTTDRITSQYSLDTARLTDDGKAVTIMESGLYFIYAQIHFENAKGRNAFAVKVGNATISKCFQSLDYVNQSLSATENSRLKTCYSASTVVLRRNQVISLVNLYQHNRILNDPYANYWGIVRFADP